MKSPRLILALALLASFPLTLSAQDGGDWRASDQNARNITGDLALANTKLFLNFTGFTIAQIRALTPAEISAVFPSIAGSIANGFLYRLNIPAAQRLAHKNTLCGSEDTQWMTTAVSGRTLHVAFFSGSDTPALTFEGLDNSSSRCGTFTYAR